MTKSLRTSLAFILPLVLLECSQRVTPEEEFAEREREGEQERVLLSPAEAPPALTSGPTVGEVDEPEGSGTIRGSIVLATAGDAAADPGSVVFLFVRAAGATEGPPLAVQRLSASGFPLDFAIGPADAMLPGSVFPERVTVEARLDGDGDPLTRGPDDWSARSAPLFPGATGVTLPLAPGAADRR